MGVALVVQTFGGDHIGFVLTHFETDTSAVGQYQGECVFMALPSKVEFLKHPLTDRMYEHKFAGEHMCVLTVTESQNEYSISKDGVRPLRIILGREDGRVLDVASNSEIGRVIRAKTET